MNVVMKNYVSPKNLLKIENFGDFLLITYFCISLVRRKKYYFCLENHYGIHVSYGFCWYEDVSLTKSVPQTHFTDQFVNVWNRNFMPWTDLESFHDIFLINKNHLYFPVIDGTQVLKF